MIYKRTLKLIVIGLLTTGYSTILFAETDASQVAYSNSIGLRSKTGKKVKNVQTAIDALGRRLNSLKATISSRPSTQDSGITFSGKVYDVRGSGTSVGENSVTLTLTPSDSSSSAGTWTSTPFNVFAAYEQIFEGNTDPTVRGTYTGSYMLVGDRILTFNIVTPLNNTLQTGRAADITLRGNELTISSGPAALTVVVLTKQ